MQDSGYLYPDIMKRLAAKLKSGLKPGATVVSSNFPLPEFIPSKILRLQSSMHNDRMYVYKICPKRSGQLCGTNFNNRPQVQSKNSRGSR